MHIEPERGVLVSLLCETYRGCLRPAQLSSDQAERSLGSSGINTNPPGMKQRHLREDSEQQWGCTRFNVQPEGLKESNSASTTWTELHDCKVLFCNRQEKSQVTWWSSITHTMWKVTAFFGSFASHHQNSDTIKPSSPDNERKKKPLTCQKKLCVLLHHVLSKSPASPRAHDCATVT